MADSSSLRRLLVGTALRRYREHLGLGLDDAARVLECDRSKISRIETGLRGIRPKELRELLSEYGVSEQEKVDLTAMAGAVRAATWRPDYDAVLTSTRREYLQLEMAATQLHVYDPQRVPDLLQTAEYASAIADAGPWHSPDEVRSTLVAVTLARQHAILEERQPELAVVLDEAALHRRVGGPGVMRAQLERLAEAAENIQWGTVQVLPFSSGTHAACADGPVTILRFAQTPDLGMVCLPWLGRGGTYLASQSDLACYTRAFARLSATALSPHGSARLLRQVAGTMREETAW